MSKPADTRSVWRRYRLPIALGVLAVCLYIFSIAWIVYGRGQAM